MTSLRSFIKNKYVITVVIIWILIMLFVLPKPVKKDVWWGGHGDEGKQVVFNRPEIMPLLYDFESLGVLLTVRHYDFIIEWAGDRPMPAGLTYYFQVYNGSFNEHVMSVLGTPSKERSSENISVYPVKNIDKPITIKAIPTEFVVSNAGPFSICDNCSTVTNLEDVKLSIRPNATSWLIQTFLSLGFLVIVAGSIKQILE